MQVTKSEVTKELLLSENTVFHCETEELANELLNIADSFGLKWKSGRSYIAVNNYTNYTDDTCYIFNEGLCADIGYCKNSGYQVVKYVESDFIYIEDLIKQMSLDISELRKDIDKIIKKLNIE